MAGYPAKPYCKLHWLVPKFYQLRICPEWDLYFLKFFGVMIPVTTRYNVMSENVLKYAVSCISAALQQIYLQFCLH